MAVTIWLKMLQKKSSPVLEQNLETAQFLILSSHIFPEGSRTMNSLKIWPLIHYQRLTKCPLHTCSSCKCAGATVSQPSALAFKHHLQKWGWLLLFYDKRYVADWKMMISALIYWRCKEGFLLKLKDALLKIRSHQFRAVLRNIGYRYSN